MTKREAATTTGQSRPAARRPATDAAPEIVVVEATSAGVEQIQGCGACGRMQSGASAHCATCGVALRAGATRTRRVQRGTASGRVPRGQNTRVAALPVRRTRRLRRDPGTDTQDKIRMARAEVTVTPPPPGDRKPPGDAS